MRSIYPLLIIALTLSAHAGNEGLDAIRARRQTMRRIEHPIAQRMDNGHIISVYSDDTVKTQAVSMVRMSPTTIAKVTDLASDRDTLKAAKALVKQIKANHGESVVDLTEAEIVSASESVFDTSTKDKAASATVGILLGVAAAAATGKKGNAKTKEKNYENTRNR